MANMDSWEKILQLKDRVAVIKYELDKLDREMNREFRFKQAPEKRKYHWEQGLKKKDQFRKELDEIKEQIAILIDKNRKKIRGKKK
jgi:hypothetical protein